MLGEVRWFHAEAEATTVVDSHQFDAYRVAFFDNIGDFFDSTLTEG